MLAPISYLPEGLEDSSKAGGAENAGWAGIATNVGTSETGDLRIDLTVRNDTGDWSTMRALDDKPAVLTGSDGKRTDCDTVLVGTGGHRLAPGFQIRGYTTEEGGKPATQQLYVECPGAALTPGSTLAIDYIYFNGPVDYYVEIDESNKETGTMEINLDEVVTDLTYPVGTPVDGLIQKMPIEITGLSDNIIHLNDIQRSDTGFQFTWQNTNPSKFALKTHIGIPPVVGDDGIIYGVYETLDIPSVPLTPALGKVEWTTEVAVPKDVGGLHILLSVESMKPRTYSNYVVDISDH